VLHYDDAPNALPATQPPQPGSVAAWTLEQQTSLLKMNAQLLARNDTNVAGGVYADSMTPVRPALLPALQRQRARDRLVLDRDFP
jgi:hypothetical protein